MKIALGSDHAGVGLKKEVMLYLESHSYVYEDFGTCRADESVDYPLYAREVARKVASGEYDLGILICGTGIGISIAANKVPGVRCALCHDTFSAKAAREHNNANILAMGERVIGRGLAMEVVDAFLGQQFAGGRHTRRVDQIGDIEKEYSRDER